MHMSHPFLPIDFSWLAKFWKQRRFLIFLVLFLTVFSIAVRTAYPLMFKFVLDKLTLRAEPSEIRFWVLLLVCVGIFQTLMFAILPNTRAYGNLVFGKLMREHVFEKILKKGYDFFLKFRTGDVITRLTDDIEGSDMKLAWFSCSGVMRPVEMSLVILFSVGVMLSLNWKLTLFIFLPFPFFIWLLASTMKELETKSVQRQESISEINSLLETSISGIRIVKGFSSESQFGEAFSERLTQRISSEVAFIRVQSKLETVGILVNHFGIIIALFVGGIFTIRGEMSVGSFFVFANYFQFLVEPFFTIGYFFAMTKVNGTYIQRLKELEEYPDLENKGTKQIDRIEVIQVDHLTLGYKDKPIVHDVSFQLEKGKTIAIVGPIGSGKTTILEGLLGELKPLSGQITINQIPIDLIETKSCLSKMGYVPQESILFSVSIKENLQLGDVSITDSQIQSSLISSCFYDDLQLFPLKENTVVGQRGVELSGGQKQRLSISRALVRNPEFLLLDDVTSALDAETEEKFWQGFRNDYPDTAVVVVTHRIHTASRADEVIMLERGRIVAKGHHLELLETNERYRQFVESEKIEEAIYKK